MFTTIDTFLNQTTMYRLLLYYLGGLLGIAIVYSYLGTLPFNALFLAASAAFLLGTCWLTNAAFARLWNIPTNEESALITGLILTLIITPEAPDTAFLFLLSTAVLAMASKYLLAIKGKHVFNPAAFGVAASSLFIDQSATWWVGGTTTLLPYVLVGGFLIIRKIRRTDLVVTYLTLATLSSVAPALIHGNDALSTLSSVLTHTPIFFFAFVMITEPLTTPPRRVGRITYGGLVGTLSGQWVNIASYYFTPELALLAGNIFSYLVSPKFKAIVQLKEVHKLAQDTYEFIFTGGHPHFLPGQYTEWTLPASLSDSRGNRRYFTISSSPTESELRLGIKFYPRPSTFKEYLAALTPDAHVLVGSIAGDFTLPRNPKKKLVFIAGGIGVTPFRSMAKYLTDTREQRDIVLLYSNKGAREIAYKDIFDAAEAAGIGFRTVYTLTDKIVPAAWTGGRGFIDAAMIQREVPDYVHRTFYISGPHGMVEAYSKTLRGMGVPRRRIKTDFFPGFA